MSTFTFNVYLVQDIDGDGTDDYVLQDEGRIVLETLSISVDTDYRYIGGQHAVMRRNNAGKTFVIRQANGEWYLVINRHIFVGKFPTQAAAVGALYGYFTGCNGHDDGFAVWLTDSLEKGSVLEPDGPPSTTIGTVLVAGDTTVAPSTATSYTATASGDATDIVWTWSVTGGTFLESGTGASRSITFLQEATYTVTATATSATATDSPVSGAALVVVSAPATGIQMTFNDAAPGNAIPLTAISGITLNGTVTADNNANFNCYLDFSDAADATAVDTAMAAAGTVDGNGATFTHTTGSPAGMQVAKTSATRIQFKISSANSGVMNTVPVDISFSGGGAAINDSLWSSANASPSDVSGTTSEFVGSTPTARWMTPSGSVVDGTTDVEIMAISYSSKLDTRSLDDATPQYPDGIAKVEVLTESDTSFSYEVGQAAFDAQSGASTLTTQTLCGPGDVTGISYYCYKTTVDTSSWEEGSIHEIRACVYPIEGTPFVLQGSEAGTVAFDRSALAIQTTVGAPIAETDTTSFEKGYHSLYLTKKRNEYVVNLSTETFDRAKLQTILAEDSSGRGVEILLNNDTGADVTINLNDGSVAGADYGNILTETFSGGGNEITECRTFTRLKAMGAHKITLDCSEISFDPPQIAGMNWELDGFDIGASSSLRVNDQNKIMFKNCVFPKRWDFYLVADGAAPSARRANAIALIKANLNTSGWEPDAADKDDFKWLVSSYGNDTWTQLPVATTDTRLAWKSTNNSISQKPIDGMAVNLDTMPNATDWDQAMVDGWARKPDGTAYADAADVDTYWTDTATNSGSLDWSDDISIRAEYTNVTYTTTGRIYMKGCDIDGGLSPVKKLMLGQDVRVRNMGNDSFSACQLVVGTHTCGTGALRNPSHPWDTYHNDVFQFQDANQTNTLYSYNRCAQDATDLGGYQDNQLFNFRNDAATMIQNFGMFMNFILANQGSSTATTGNWSGWWGRDMVVRDNTFIMGGIYPDYVSGNGGTVNPNRVNRAINWDISAMDSMWKDLGTTWDSPGLLANISNAAAKTALQTAYNGNTGIYGTSAQSIDSDLLGAQTQVNGSEEYYGRHNYLKNTLISSMVVSSFDAATSGNQKQWFDQTEWTALKTSLAGNAAADAWSSDVEETRGYAMALIQDTNWPTANDYLNRSTETGTWYDMMTGQGGFLNLRRMSGWVDEDNIVVSSSKARGFGDNWTNRTSDQVDLVQTAFNATSTVDYNDGWAVADTTDGGNGSSDLTGRGCHPSATLNVVPNEIYYKVKFDGTDTLISNGTEYSGGTNAASWNRDPSTFPWKDWIGEDGFVPQL